MVTQEQKDEIRTYFRGCIDPKKQIEILCELFPQLKRSEILEVLGVNSKGNIAGEEVRTQRAMQEGKKEKNEGKAIMNKNANGYHADVIKDVCNDILNNGVSYRGAAEKWGVPYGNVSRWVAKAKERQAEFLSYGEKKMATTQAKEVEGAVKKTIEDISEKSVGLAEVDVKSNDKSNDKGNDFSLSAGDIERLGILTQEESEWFDKIVTKLEIFKKGYRYARGAKL